MPGNFVSGKIHLCYARFTDFVTIAHYRLTVLRQIFQCIVISLQSSMPKSYNNVSNNNSQFCHLQSRSNWTRFFQSFYKTFNIGPWKKITKNIYLFFKTFKLEIYFQCASALFVPEELTRCDNGHVDQRWWRWWWRKVVDNLRSEIGFTVCLDKEICNHVPHSNGAVRSLKHICNNFTRRGGSKNNNSETP